MKVNSRSEETGAEFKVASVQHRALFMYTCTEIFLLIAQNKYVRKITARVMKCAY